MTTEWCWACRKEHPLLDDVEFDAVWKAYQIAATYWLFLRPPDGSTPAQIQMWEKAAADFRALPSGLNVRQIRYWPLQQAYQHVTGLRFEGDDPKVIMHYRKSYFGPPCPHCGILLRNKNAKQCFECGMDWHNPDNVVCRKRK